MAEGWWGHGVEWVWVWVHWYRRCDLCRHWPGTHQHEWMGGGVEEGGGIIVSSSYWRFNHIWISIVQQCAIRIDTPALSMIFLHDIIFSHYPLHSHSHSGVEPRRSLVILNWMKDSITYTHQTTRLLLVLSMCCLLTKYSMICLWLPGLLSKMKAFRD